MTSVGIAATASYLPGRWMTAAEIGAASGIPEDVIVEKFGLRGKHVAGEDEHVSDMSVAAADRLFEEQGVDPGEVDAVVYYGSTWKDHSVWQAAPYIAHRLGITDAFVLELDYVSCGTPVALRVCRDLMLAEPQLRTVLAVAACRESHLIDYTNERARFTYNFGDGAVAGLLRRDHPSNVILGCHTITDGSFALDVMVPAGGSVEPASHATVDAGRHTLDVPDPRSMKERLDPISMDRFVTVARTAMERSGASLEDVDALCGIHMKRSIHDAIVAELGVDPDRAVYLDDTGHMSGVDPLLGLDRLHRAGDLAAGDLVLLLAAGTGYTWASAVVRWGPA
ncbi:MAG: 3-oxoacyl-ACP synthase [Actinobacteria bacterium]|nr:3-oxoacyl-ACP synthase [Actinomycetota bacterium]